MESRLGEALEMVLHMRGVPKETKEIIKKVINLEWEISSYMDWNDYEDYCDSGELKKYLRELFVEKKEVVK